MASIVKQCFSESTMHGLPNMAVRKSRIVKVLWIFFTLSAIGGLIAHSTVLIMKFLEQDVSISFLPKAIPFLQPDILICPQRIFALEYVIDPPINESDFIQNISQKVIDLNEKIEKYNRKMIVEMVVSNIDVASVFKAFSYRKNQLFLKLECNNLRNKTDFRNYSIEPEYNWKHFICFRITPSICKIQYPASSLDINFYIHNYNINKTSKISKIDKILKQIDFHSAYGVIIYFLDNMENLEENSEKVILNGGSENHVSIKSVQFNYQTRNNFQCLDYDPILTYKNFLKDDVKYANKFVNSSTCFINSYCQAIYNTYACRIPKCIVPIDSKDKFIPCYNDTRLIKRYTSNGTINGTLQINDAIIFQICRPIQPCTSIEYEVKINRGDFRLDNFIPDNLDLLNSLANDNNPGIKEFMNNSNDSNQNRWKNNFIMVIFFTKINIVNIIFFK